MWVCELLSSMARCLITPSAFIRQRNRRAYDDDGIDEKSHDTGRGNDDGGAGDCPDDHRSAVRVSGHGAPGSGGPGLSQYGGGGGGWRAPGWPEPRSAWRADYSSCPCSSPTRR